MRGKLCFDGGARPTNPGHAGFAAVLNMDNKEDIIVSRYIGWKTNNEAEYFGLIVGLKMALDHDVTDIQIVSDSKTVVEQINGGYKVRAEKLKPLVTEAKNLIEEFELWTIGWLGRGENSQADALCTSAIHFGMNANPFVPDSIKAKRLPAKQVDPFQSDSSRRRRLSAAGSVRDMALSAILASIRDM